MKRIAIYLIVLTMILSGCMTNTETEDYLGEINDLKAENESLTSQVTNLNNELDQYKDSEITLYTEIEVLDETLQEITEEYNLFKEGYDILSEDYINILTSYNILTGDYDDLSTQVNQDEINREQVIMTDEFIDGLDIDEIIVVSTVTEFVNAIRPNAHIILNSGLYNLSEVNQDQIDNPYVSFYTDEIAYGVFVEGVDHLIIEGVVNEYLEIVIDELDASVINFKDSSNILLTNVLISHTDAQGASCSGNLIDLENCDNVFIEKSHLYGCGFVGVYMRNSNNIYVNESIIADCSSNGIHMYQSNNLVITYSIIRNCDDGALRIRESEGIYIYDSELDGEYITSY